MQDAVQFRLQLSSHVQNVGVVRAAISGLAAAAQLDDELLADLNTVVSEACNNVSVHAYPEGEIGPMQVEVACFRDRVEAVVTDRGQGITQISTRSDRMGLGLAVISALADRSAFHDASGGGSEVHARFTPERDPVAAAAGRVWGIDHQRADDPFADPRLHAWLDGEVVLWCSPPGLQRYVLARMLTYVAASAHFSITSVEDLAVANAALADHVERDADGWIGTGIDPAPRLLHLTVGPLAPAPVPDVQFGRSVDSVGTADMAGHGVLELTIADRQQRG